MTCWISAAAGGDEVFRLLALARIIERTSNIDALRLLEETGLAPPSYATLNGGYPNTPGSVAAEAA